MKKLIYIPIVLCFLLLAQGCTDLLEKAQPTTSTTPARVLNDAASVEALRAALYDDFHGFTFTTRNFLAPDALADNSFVRSGATRFDALNFNTGTNASRSGLNDGAYGVVYGILLDANAIINGVPDGVLQEPKATQFPAEARVLRAFAMHYLVRALGYEPGMIPSTGPGAGFDLGIIVRTDYVASSEDVQTLPRNTVAQTYSQIIDDLETAEAALTGTDNNFVTKAFAQALLARVNLYAGNNDDANFWAGEALSSGPGLATTQADVTNMFDESSGIQESYFSVDTDPSTESQGVNNSLNAYTANQWVAQLPTQSLIDLYEAGDYRLEWYAPCFDENGGSVALSTCQTVNTQGLEIQKWNAEQGQFADDYPHIRAAELKLIQAEARFRLTGVVDGLGPLNELRQARGLGVLTPADLALTAQQSNVNPGLDPFIGEILTERRRELAFEGHRFFDLKRLGLNVPDQDGNLKISYTSYKMLDDIDPDEVATNSELIQNPGY